jgi:NADH-quinone oxidoreductase subunit L
MFMTFLGRKRWGALDGPGDGYDPHPHEAPALMKWTMIVLAVGSVALGGLLAINSGFVRWLEPVVTQVEGRDPVLPAWLIMASTLLLVAAGIAFAWWMYIRQPVPVDPPPGNALTRAARADLYQDAFNENAVLFPGQIATRSLVYAERGVDNAFAGVGKGVGLAGQGLRKAQNGYVRTYAATALGGLLVVAAVVWALAG